MSEKTLTFDNAEVNKKEFHTSKQPIALDFVNVDEILISDKYKLSDTGFRCFIGLKMIISLDRYILFYLK